MCKFKWRYCYYALQGIKKLGDTLYGNASKLIDRQALHAYKVKFVHPITGLNVEYVAEVPLDMINLM